MAPSNSKDSELSGEKIERNEYIPGFIANRPFYLPDESGDAASASDYLAHQRLPRSKRDKEAKKSYLDAPSLKLVNKPPTKWIEGSCENCGGRDHKKKECLERIRAVGAKYSGKNIRGDRKVEKNENEEGWDAKRDRWKGYNPREYTSMLNEKGIKGQLKASMDHENIVPEPDKTSTEEAEAVLGVVKEGDFGEKQVDDDAKYEEESDMGRSQSTATRNLRMREDTAKYLLDLDLDSAKYDPKTRSMVNAEKKQGKAAILLAEEGFVKASGDAAEFDKATRASWDMHQRDDRDKFHIQANPTSGEFFRKKQAEEEEKKRQARQNALFAMYGDQSAYKRDPSKGTDVIENENYVEYDEKGRVKYRKPIKKSSFYPEDIYINNHTSVWGSWWHDFKWGYECCHSTIKNSYCTGEEGKKALDNADKLVNLHQEAKQEEHVSDAVEHDQEAKTDSTSRKRTLRELQDGVTDEQMEEYRKKKIQADDPMAKHLGRDELV